MSHVMLDIETTGLMPGCRILSIGACTFDIDGETDNEFYKRIWADSYPQSAHDDKNTMDWWDKQNPDVKQEAFGGCTDYATVLFDFIEYIDEIKPDTIWCKGAAFDFPNINHWLVEQLPYQKLRCARTYLNAANVKVKIDASKAHNALEDAVAQARAMADAADNLCHFTFQ